MSEDKTRAARDTLEKVAGEFQGEVIANLEKGKSDAVAKIESARRDAAEIVAKTLETSERQAESLKRQISGAAELEARNAQLKSMEKAVNDVFDLAVKEVSAPTVAAYEKSLTRLINEGMEVIGPKAKIACASKDRKAVSSAIRKLSGGKVRLSLEKGDLDTIGGVVLMTSDGSVKFDNTFEARLERMRSGLRKDVAGILTSKAKP